MDNITVIVEDYPQEITVQVTTTGITVDQANQIIANTQKVSDINHVTLELFNVDNTSDANKPVSDATNQVLNTETQARIDADNLLQSNIDSEATTRLNADNVLQSNIDSEAATRLANDNTIQDNLNTESSTRLANDNTLQSNINNLDTRVALNDVKVGITPTQASDIATNNAKVSDINHVTIELPNVNNTSDLNKPISTATQSALDLKVNTLQDSINTQNTFKSVSFAMDYSDRVRDDSGNVESRDCVMNEYLKMIN